MPGIKRQRAEEDGAKVNGSKKVKALPENASKADKKFATKTATKDKSKAGKYDVKDKLNKSNGVKKSAKASELESVSEEEDFGGFDEDEEMEVDEDAEGGAVKPQKMAKGDAGKISSAPVVMKGSTDGVNGKNVVLPAAVYTNMESSNQISRIAHQAERDGARAKSGKAQCRCYPTGEEVVGATASEV